MRVKITDFGTAKLLKQDEIKNGQPLAGRLSSASGPKALAEQPF
jgi:hypothetical protein